MKSAAGLWIDHGKAVIVVVSAEGEETKQIEKVARSSQLQNCTRCGRI